MILHVRPVGLLTGIRVERVVGMWRAYRSMVLDTDWPPETPLGGSAPGPRMRRVLYLFDFWMFHEHVFFCVSKLEKPILRWDLAPSKFASRWWPKCTTVRAAPWSTTLQNCWKMWIPDKRLRSRCGTRATKKTSKSIVLAQDLVKKFASKKNAKTTKTHDF